MKPNDHVLRFLATQMNVHRKQLRCCKLQRYY